MAKKMPLRDFRAVRTMLEVSDFAYAPGRAQRRVEDLIDEPTRKDIQTLAETAAIFTSNDHGRDLSLLNDLWERWVESLRMGNVPVPERAVHRASLIATDEFQAATFNALHGFYRVVADSLRTAVEQMVIATNLGLKGKNADIRSWLNGEQ